MMYHEITEDVYDITCRKLPSGKRYRVFYCTGGSPTFFDSGLDETVDSVVECISDIGIDPERIIITHSDGDHIGGLSALKSRYNLESWVPEQSTDVNPDLIDHRYSDGDLIGSYKAVHIPGHTADNYALIDEKAKVAVMGDAVSGADQRGLPEGYFHLPPAAYSDDLNQAEKNLERLLEFDFETALVYHGSPVEENAREKLRKYVNFPGKP